MLIEKVKRMKPLQRLLYWIAERESIRLKREDGWSKPWTNDVILQNYRFCNVRRMDDAVSKWLLENWYEPNFNHKNMLLACVAARIFNTPATLAHLRFPKSWDWWARTDSLQVYRNTADTVFNAAYIVSTNGQPVDKIGYVCKHVIAPFNGVKLQLHNADTLEEGWKEIREYNGMGSFTAGQVIMDMRHAVSGDWPDAKTWAPMGPGSRRGMNRLHGRELNSPMGQVEFLDKLQSLIIKVNDKLPESITSRLEAMDIQNCLCEFFKYEKALSGEGKPKQRYPGV